MVVKVEDISIGAKFDDIIWNYWVTFKLSDETLLTVFDENCLSSNFEEKSFISVKLKALFVQKKEKEDLTKFEGMIFKKDMDYFFKNDLVKIKVDKDNINDEKIPLNTTLVLFFGRIDLIDFSIDPKSLPNLMGNKKKKSNITSIVMKDGYYISDTVKWEDWHAGHKFEGTKYYLIKFLDDNKAIRASNDSNKIPESIFDYRMEYRDSYRLIDNKTLEITINPESEWSTKKKFTILSPKLLLDENLLEYHFVYDPSTDLTEQQKSKS